MLYMVIHPDTPNHATNATVSFDQKEEHITVISLAFINKRCRLLTLEKASLHSHEKCN